MVLPKPFCDYDGFVGRVDGNTEWKWASSNSRGGASAPAVSGKPLTLFANASVT